MTDAQPVPTDPQALAEAVTAAMWSRDRTAQALGMRIEHVGPSRALNMQIDESGNDAQSAGVQNPFGIARQTANSGDAASADGNVGRRATFKHAYIFKDQIKPVAHFLSLPAVRCTSSSIRIKA